MAARNMRFFFSFHVGAKLAKIGKNWQKRPGYDGAIYLLSQLTLPIF